MGQCHFQIALWGSIVVAWAPAFGERSMRCGKELSQLALDTIPAVKAGRIWRSYRHMYSLCDFHPVRSCQNSKKHAKVQGYAPKLAWTSTLVASCAPAPPPRGRAVRRGDRPQKNARAKLRQCERTRSKGASFKRAFERVPGRRKAKDLVTTSGMGPPQTRRE